MSVTGRTYYERGKPVTVLIGWNGKIPPKDPNFPFVNLKGRAGPRNVMIRRADGTMTIRPFRGLRTTPPPGH